MIGFFVVAPFETVLSLSVSDVILDLGDLLLLPALAAVLVERKRPRLPASFTLRLAFFLYLALTAAAYAKSVYALGYLSDPVRAGYQFYRYAWKPALLFPLTYYLVYGHKSRARVLALVLTIIVVADLNALAGIWQGRSGSFVTGLFGAMGWKNAVASSVLLPMFVALGVAVSLRDRMWKAFAYGSFATMVMLLWYAGSRGAAVAFMVGLVAYLALGQGSLKLAVGLVVSLTILLAIHPDVGKGSGIRENFMEVAQGTEAGTLKWRLTERWPYFLDRVRDNPWLGVGTEVDLSLGDEGANTPHNGYLALAIRSGVPALGFFLCLLSFTLALSATVALKGSSSFDKGVGAGAFAGTVAFATHNMVEFTFTNGSAAYLFWMSCGLVASMHAARLAKAPTRVRSRSTDHQRVARRPSRSLTSGLTARGRISTDRSPSGIVSAALQI